MEKRIKRVDYYPRERKVQVARKIFVLLDLKEEEGDFCESTISGGGGTVTKQAWGKIRKRLEEMSAEDEGDEKN